jgi:hypothetical protein
MLQQDKKINRLTIEKTYHFRYDELEDILATIPPPPTFKESFFVLFIMYLIIEYFLIYYAYGNNDYTYKSKQY